jgi:hypothetical protein
VVERLRAELRLELVSYRTTPDAVLAEVLLPPRSRLIGRTLADVEFRNRFRSSPPDRWRRWSRSLC